MNGPRILVVEDYQPIQNAIRDILEAEDYVVLTANDGLQALQVMEQVRPDLIIADIMMPRMDGYAYYEATRARPEWVLIPFIFLTAKGAKDDMLKGKALGVEDYIIKPFNPQELLVAVRARLGRAQAIRKAAESELDELKQEIVNILSHELRTPLTFVRGYTELALEDISSASPEELQDFLLGIKRGTDRLTRLVEDLLLLVRLDSGRLAEECQNSGNTYNDAGRLAHDIIVLSRAEAEQRGVFMVAEVQPDLPPVWMCRSFLMDALRRLVENAIKFSPKNKNKTVTIKITADDKEFSIAIIDQGIGIAPTELPHIFERFRQIDRDRMEQQGLGLGLAISRALIRVQQGDIEATSIPDQGSTFTIHLPLTRQA